MPRPMDAPFNIEDLIQIGVENPEAVADQACVFVVCPGSGASYETVEYALDAIWACTTWSRSIPRRSAISLAGGRTL
jgi:hypothetical protein